ncbi:chorismate mutase [Clostridium rectalis]|uniref:chorismate mutase n=1 Tax=Clostridium rectalis TaxID=2040295 RepID=UPI000F6404F2|nr:chorismate mutase [Clostridium rectalis]
MIAIRGAITIEKNCKEDIKKASIKLFSEILEKNNLDISEIISIIFSCTDDITKAYPGKFIREEFNLDKVALMHFNEMKVENALKMCIRILILTKNHKENINYVYLGKSQNLRKDLFK